VGILFVRSLLTSSLWMAFLCRPDTDLAKSVTAITNKMPITEIIRTALIMADSTPVSPIDAANATYTRVFWISVCVVFGLTIATAVATAILGVWFWNSGNKVQELVQADADSRIQNADDKAIAAIQATKQANATADILRKNLDALAANSFEPTAYLSPGNGPTPEFHLPPDVDAATVIEPNTVITFLGSNALLTNKFPYPAIKQLDQSIVVIERDSLGVYVSARIYNEDGVQVCTIAKNMLVNNDKDRFRIVHDKPNRLVLSNRENNQILLDVEFINEHCVRFLGDFYMRDKVHVVITDGWVSVGDGNNRHSDVTTVNMSAGLKYLPSRLVKGAFRVSF
jgi:hypothetical protein